jgi:hypothetical protein
VENWHPVLKTGDDNCCIMSARSAGEQMAATKIIVNHNCSIRVEGDF